MIGLTFNFLIFISWNILTFLVIELLIKVKHPLSTNYRFRFKLYALLTSLISPFEVFIMQYVGAFGLSSLGTCYLKDGSKAYWVGLVVIFVNTPIIMTCMLFLMNTQGFKNNKALQKILLGVISMTFSWGVPTAISAIRTLFNHDIIILDYFGFFIGCISGILLALSRLASKEIFKRLLQSSSKKHSSKTINEILIEQSSVGILFNNITQITIKNLLLLLSLALVSCEACKENYCYSYKKKKFYFKEDDYSKLSNLVDLSLFRVEKNGIWEYESEVFMKIRKLCNISLEDLISSICSNSNFQKLKNFNSSGKSGAFIFITSNNKFVIKTVTRYERYFLLNLLPAYSEHLTKHRDSKLVRILGLFKLLNTKLSFIIMENIFRPKENTIFFDLKGSTKNRHTPMIPNTNPVLKDQNILDMEKKFILSPEASKSLLRTLKSDSKFLKKFNIIDYSLLLAFYPSDEKIDSNYFIEGLENTSYSLGIIDFLQDYTLYKKLEVLLKKFRGFKDISVCPPRLYSTRFVNFMEKLIIY